MFTQMREELKELLRLTAETNAKDASLAAKPHIQPPQEYWTKRHSDGERIAHLIVKYELN
jgi:hypothetical protein